jgi:hypothetical protein
LYDNAKDIFSGRPAIDAAAVVSDLIPLATYGFDQMQVLNSVHFAEDDVADVNTFLTGRFKGHKLAILNLAAHAISSRAKADASTSL